MFEYAISVLNANKIHVENIKQNDFNKKYIERNLKELSAAIKILEGKEGEDE